MAEWSKAPDSKSGLGQPNGGSNPSLSAKSLLVSTCRGTPRIIPSMSPRQARRRFLGSLAAAALLALAFAWYSVRLAWQSHQFNDVSTGNDATPLWIPQLTMAAGTVIFAIAFIDELVLELRGRRVRRISDEPLRNE